MLERHYEEYRKVRIVGITLMEKEIRYKNSKLKCVFDLTK